MRSLTRRSFFGLLGAAPLAAPAILRAAAEPVVVGADVQRYGAVVGPWVEVIGDWTTGYGPASFDLAVLACDFSSLRYADIPVGLRGIASPDDVAGDRA